MQPGLRFNCHLSAGTQNLRPSTVLGYLDAHALDGAVLLLPEAMGIRNEAQVAFLKQSSPRVTPLVPLSCLDARHGLQDFIALGLRATFVSWQGGGGAAHLAQRLQPLHETLPKHCHIEVSCRADCFALLAPRLARWERRFVLVLEGPPADVPESAFDRIQWWAGMGSLYVKCAGGSWAAAPSWLADLPPDRLLWAGVPAPEWVSVADLDRNAQELYGLQ